MNYGDPSLPDRFWAKVYPEPNTGCWLWGAAEHDSLPYGIWNVDGQGKMGRAHVSTFVAAGGVVSRERPYVLHACDQPSCCNPEHLRAGTQIENMADARERKRRKPGRTAKISHEVADLIRARVAAGERQAALSRELGLSSGAVSMIVNNLRWRTP